MFSIPVTDGQYRRAAALAGIEDIQLAPVDDPEFRGMRIAVDAVLEKALRIGLNELACLRNNPIEKCTEATLLALNGGRLVACDECGEIVDRLLEQGTVLLVSDEVKFNCERCASAVQNAP